MKWQGTLLLRPLLRLPMELAPLAIECFECILRYCGDLPPDPELTEVKCVYTILMVIGIHFPRTLAQRLNRIRFQLMFSMFEIFHCSIVTNI